MTEEPRNLAEPIKELRAQNAVEATLVRIGTRRVSAEKRVATR
jgi:hypothetical protein